jgi:MFS family permease
MTVGTPWKSILRFTVPMIIGNMAQQMYSTVDSIVVGHYIGDNALAAVGSATPLLNLLLALFIGVSTGTGIMVSQYFGARDREKLSHTVGNCITVTAFACLIVIAVGAPLIRPFLAVLNTPESIIDWCADYLIIYFLGIAGFFFIQDTGVKIAENQNYFANIFYGFRPSVMKANKPLYVTLVLLALFNISIQIFMPYLILYYTESLGLTDYVLIFAPAIILSAAFTAVYGRVYDKYGFKTAIIPTLAMLMVGYTLLFFVRHTALVFIGSLVMMCGFIGTGAVIGALIRDCTPKNKAGMFQGLRIVGQVLIPGVVGPAIGAAVLQNAETLVNTDGTTSFIPNENIFLAAFIAAIFAWLILIPLCKLVKRK